MRLIMEAEQSTLDIAGLVALKRFELMRNAARTRRCHTQMVIHDQSVGEHTFGAIAILDYIVPDCRKELWRAMLYHDAPEAITGDVPAPAKWEHPYLEDALRRVEQRIKDDHWISTNLFEDEAKALKFADIMELVWYGIEELRMGNRGVAGMVQMALDAIRKRELYTVSIEAFRLMTYTVATVDKIMGSGKHD